MAAKEAIWEWNVEKQTASWSDLYSERYGRQPEDTSGEWWFEHIHPEDRERVRSSFFGALDGNATSWVCEYRMLCVDGSWAAIYDRGSIARDTDGRPLRVIGAMLDVTEIKRTQQELEQRTEELVRSNEQLQRFAFVVSHDLQAPLRMIEDFSQRLEREKLDEDADRLARGVLDAVGRMRAIIQDLLEFAQISVQPAPPTTRTDSNFILCLALQHLQGSIQQTQAQITSEHLPIVMVNDTRLLRVFQNLIGNAVKYCEQTPHIHISARRDGDMWVFSVKDNGIGIAPDHHERIFGLFERLHGRDQYSGTGIGLASVKRIIESQGGRIWVESDVEKARLSISPWKRPWRPPVVTAYKSQSSQKAKRNCEGICTGVRSGPWQARACIVRLPALDQSAFYGMKHCFKPVVSAELLIDGVEMIS